MTNSEHDLDKEIEAGLDRAEKMLRRQRLFISGGILLALGAAAFGANIGYKNYQYILADRTATAQQIYAEQTATQRPIQTATAKVHQTTTAQQLMIEQTATKVAAQNATKTVRAANSQATRTKRAVPTVTARAKIDSDFLELQRTVLSYTGDLSKAVFRFYDTDGKLKHEDDGYVETYCTGHLTKNFVLTAKIQNPYSANEHDWDYGFLFRDTGADGEFRLIVSSDKSWQLILRNDDDWTWGDSGETDYFLKTESEQSNTIYLIVSGDKGYFFINKKYIATLDLSKKTMPGDICIATGMYDGNAVDGKTTKFSDFTLWSLP